MHNPHSVVRQYRHNPHFRNFTNTAFRVGSNYLLDQANTYLASSSRSQSMKNGHKRNSSHKQSTKRKRIKSALIEATEIEATGVSQLRFSYNHKAPAKAKYLKALSRPVVHRELGNYSLLTNTGVCNYIETSSMGRSFTSTRLSEAITQATATTPASNLHNTQVLLKSVKLKRILTNRHNEPCYVLWHEYLCKTDTSNSPLQLASTQSVEEGATSTLLSGTGVYFPDNDLTKYKNIRNFWTLHKRKRIYLKPGETIVLYSSYNINKMQTFDQISDAPDTWVGGVSNLAVMQIQGACATTVTATGFVSIASANVAMVERIESVVYPYPLPTAKLDRFDTVNGLPITATANTKHINVDTDVVDIGADAA
jgi:hypothetical protein